MTYKNYRQEISNSYMYGNRDKIQEILIEMTTTRFKLDQWFDLFLERFGERMDEEVNTSPLWRKYYKKFDEYADLKNQMLIAEHYLKNMKAQNV